VVAPAMLVQFDRRRCRTTPPRSAARALATQWFRDLYGGTLARMSEQPTHVAVGKARVLGIDAEYPGLLNVEVALVPVPDPQWQRIFAQGAPDEWFPHPMHPPRISGDRVTMTPPDDQLETYMEALRNRISTTNEAYDRIVGTRPDQLGPMRRAEIEEQERRIEQAQRKLDDAS